jgi:hypothetical protein
MTFKRILIALAIVGVSVASIASAVPGEPSQDCLDCREFVIEELEDCVREGGNPVECLQDFEIQWEVCEDWFCDPIV